ncbi:MAG: hypothetical protein IT440_12150, partial [Phycisphaeraceae bacterium]|nr:hypothetical protein [Phycisphaeraceae bacterium]
RRRLIRPLVAGKGNAGVLQAVRDLASAVKSGTAHGGMLFVRNAALAGCYANRCPSLRAVVGTSVEAVEQAVHDMGANVLIVEYLQHGLKSTSAMVDRLMSQSPHASALVQRDLADLQRMG